ncbi:hypothetical protein TIFTF001_004736 [Ficus carica]|uniref:Uncharacterized protein n=1 Tax=Ficus carica TaxID=3494 RepID=A0AA87ZDY7_FICCA|nr:hypothetical protein TIFTF001_004736 [Ficus carica]
MRRFSLLALVLFLTILLVLTEQNSAECRALRSTAKISTNGVQRAVQTALVSTKSTVRDKNGRVLASDRVYNKLSSGPSGKGDGH